MRLQRLQSACIDMLDAALSREAGTKIPPVRLTKLFRHSDLIGLALVTIGILECAGSEPEPDVLAMRAFGRWRAYT